MKLIKPMMKEIMQVLYSFLKTKYYHARIVCINVSLIILYISCQDSNIHRKNIFFLEKSNKQLIFPLDERTKNSPLALFAYKDKTGKEYLTFQNPIQNEILFYDMNLTNLDFKVMPSYDGNNGVGPVSGYYVKNLDSIFLTIHGFNDIVLIDKNSVVKEKMEYYETNDNIPLLVTSSISSLYHPLLFFDNKIYIVPECNRWAESNWVCAYIDLIDKSVNAIPSFSYPSFPGQDNRKKRASAEDYLSRCFNGKQFVYSFYYDEDIYIAPLNHGQIKKIKVTSKYIDKVRIPDDYGNLTIEELCENPNYGNLLYDEYRDVYYRIAYPKTMLEKGIRVLELLRYGRKNFSIIILDKGFNIIGETLFPDYMYNSQVMFIREDGLYISCNHYLNPEYSDDVISFIRFNLVKNK
ncbi:MAG: DUF4221 domain-containing protein [Tannerellaceae bacterium]|jgi:hypothetical protein|nr:DUF4221 domain-containing protein [Tannerellaceae bacterium]